MPASALIENRSPSKLSLLGLPAADLVELFESLGEKPYRAHQLMRWLYERHVTDFGAMTDLSAGLRKQLGEIARTDLEYMEWLDRMPIGRPYREEIDQILRRAGRRRSADVESAERRGLFRRR